MKSNIIKYCVICQAPFHPDRRVENRRIVCDKTECQRQKASQNQQRWSEQNPGYFKGRYPKLKDQILANKRKKAPSKRQPKLGIQDDLTPNNNSLLNLLENVKSIQDDITDKITISKLQLQRSLEMVYKTNQPHLF